MENLVVPLLGGGLIGLAASVLLVGHGRVAGISGIIGALVMGQSTEWAWRAVFIAGLISGGLLLRLFAPHLLAMPQHGWLWMAAAGLVVGIGTRLGNGCTSGHGVCGVSQLAPRSLVATLTFIATGMLTVALVRALGGLA